MWPYPTNSNAEPTANVWSGGIVPIVITPPDTVNITDDLATGFADDEGTTIISDR